MATADPSEPVVLLNLLRFRERAGDGVGVDGLSGEEAFQRYGQLNHERDVQYEAEILWMGLPQRSLIGDEDWDLAILVHYPSRRHVLEKLADPDYLANARVRDAALADSRLIEIAQLVPQVDPATKGTKP